MHDHGAAGFGAVSARLGAVRHVFVVLELLTLLGTFIASLRATVASGGRIHALPCGQLAGERTELRAIHAGVHRLDMRCFPFFDEARAMVEAGIARYLAVSACFGAFREVLVMHAGLLGRRLNPAQDA